MAGIESTEIGSLAAGDQTRVVNPEDLRLVDDLLTHEETQPQTELAEGTLPPDSKDATEFSNSWRQIEDKIRPRYADVAREIVSLSTELSEMSDKDITDRWVEQNVCDKWRQIADLHSPDNQEEEWVVRNIENVRQSIKERLNGKGYEFIDIHNDYEESFDSERHWRVGGDKITGPSENHKISYVWKEGLIKRGHVLRPANVSLRRVG